MLNLFPELLSYNFSVPLAFRVVSGSLFIYFGYANLTKHRASKIALFESVGLSASILWLWMLVTLETVGGIMLLVGLFTQAVALGLSIILLLGLTAKYKRREVLPWSFGFLFLLFLITASLLFLGPGFYAFDLPL